MFRLDEKLSRIRAGAYKRADFIIADAKDADMGGGVAAMGPLRQADGSWTRYRTRDEFVDSIEAVVRQDIVDIMLASVSNIERLTRRGLFANSAVKPAIRANETSDVWGPRGSTYKTHASRPFRTASLSRVRSGALKPDPAAAVALTDLGLYSITFNNDLAADIASLEAFTRFRRDAEEAGLTYFLEVFNPNVATGIAPEEAPFYVNDCILRCLAGLVEAERPLFLKIPYNGPKAMEELASFDSSLVVGVLGGGAGMTRDCFELIHQAEKYGARVALFGRKINLAESPLDMVRTMRAVADGALAPREAVAAYHGDLARQNITPARELSADNQITEAPLKSA